MSDNSHNNFGRLRLIGIVLFLIPTLPFLAFIFLLPLLLPYPLLASYALALTVICTVAFVIVQAIRGRMARSRTSIVLATLISAFYIGSITAFCYQAQQRGAGIGTSVSGLVQSLRVQKSIRDRMTFPKYDSYALTQTHAALKLREFFGLGFGKSLRILGFQLQPFRDSEMSFLFDEIFVNECYHFDSDQPRPFIIDCGSNIGASVLHFKHLYPEARILAFEPDPRTVPILKQNVSQNNLEDIRIIEKAVSNSEGTITFNLSDSSLVSSSFRGGEEHAVEVPTVRLSDFIDEPVDLLKLDIEGAEGFVLQDLVEREILPLIRQRIVEWHHHAELSTMTLGEFIQILEKQNFGYLLTAPSPERFTPGAFQDVLVFAYQK